MSLSVSYQHPTDSIVLQKNCAVDGCCGEAVYDMFCGRMEYTGRKSRFLGGRVEIGHAKCTGVVQVNHTAILFLLLLSLFIFYLVRNNNMRSISDNQPCLPMTRSSRGQNGDILGESVGEERHCGYGRSATKELISTVCAFVGLGGDLNIGCGGSVSS